MRLLHVIETTPNPEAVCALSPSSDNSYLAYPSPVPSPSTPLGSTPSAPSVPASSTVVPRGDVHIFSTRSLTVVNVIQAHRGAISCLSINSSGTLLATTSEKGTVIRVWGMPNAEKLYQFRRGTREAKIYSMNFNQVSTLLAVSSAHDTVHIFKLGPRSSGGGTNGAGTSPSSPSRPTDNSSGGATSPPDSVDSRDEYEGGYDALIEKKEKKKTSVSSILRRKSLQMTKSLGHSVGEYLPNTLTEMWEPARDFAFLTLPSSGTRCIVALSSTMPQVMVISSEGYFNLYNIDLENGGECGLIKQYSLIDSVDGGGYSVDDASGHAPAQNPVKEPMKDQENTTM